MLLITNIYAVLLVPYLFIKHALEAIKLTAYALYDQTHYHTEAFMFHFNILFELVCTYFISIPRCIFAHWSHSMYLHTLGLDDVANLKDVGSLVWQKLPSSGNEHNMKPAEHITGLLNNSSGNSAHLSIASSAVLKLWESLSKVPDFRFEDSVFVDFGCGTGFALLSAMTQPFNAVVGVELDRTSCHLAEKNIYDFRVSSTRSVPIKCNNDSVLHQDMSDFDYFPYSKQTIVLYMYEPLWTIRKPIAHEIYTRILKRAKQSGVKVIVAYFYAGWYNGDALPALRALDGVLLDKFEFDSLNFGSSETCYLYQLK